MRAWGNGDERDGRPERGGDEWVLLGLGKVHGWMAVGTGDRLGARQALRMECWTVVGFCCGTAALCLCGGRADWFGWCKGKAVVVDGSVCGNEQCSGVGVIGSFASEVEWRLVRSIDGAPTYGARNCRVSLCLAGC